VEDTGVRAGIIGEIGCDRDYITPAEERAFRAAARAHRRTGLTIMTHSARCAVGLDQLDLLDDEGVDSRRVIVGHCDLYPDSDYHATVAHRGAFVEFDTVRGSCEWETEQRLQWVRLLLEKGYLRQILLSHDVCMRSHLHAYGGNGYDFLLTGFVPRLLDSGLTKDEVNTLLVENPRAALTGE
jgi:predicted metal-dependent phosphotriesterase family hydrolase